MIAWTEQATRQLDQAHDYIALSNSEEVAARITMQIVTSVQPLATFPMSGRSGRVSGSIRVHNTGRRFSKYRDLLPTTQFIRRAAESAWAVCT